MRCYYRAPMAAFRSAMTLSLVAFLVASGATAAGAATSINCKSAKTIVGFTGGGRGGPQIDLVMRVTAPEQLEALLVRYGWERLVGEAAAIQLHRAIPARYLLMAVDGRGCYLAHAPLEEAEARALQAE